MNDTYEALLGRPANPTELTTNKAHWTAARDVGISPATVAAAIFDSSESLRHRIDATHHQLYGTNTPPALLTWWTGWLPLPGQDYDLAALTSAMIYQPDFVTGADNGQLPPQPPQPPTSSRLLERRPMGPDLRPNRSADGPRTGSCYRWSLNSGL